MNKIVRIYNHHQATDISNGGKERLKRVVRRTDGMSFVQSGNWEGTREGGRSGCNARGGVQMEVCAVIVSDPSKG